jgi:hypothetical protein
MRPRKQLEPHENILFSHILVHSDGGENRVKSPNSRRSVFRNGDPMRGWLLSLQDNVTPNLMDPLVSPALAEVLYQFLSA